MIKKHSLVNLTSELQALGCHETMIITFKNVDSIQELIETISYQLPLKVTEYRAYATGLEGVFDDYELCPKCGIPLERTYQTYCDKCGQLLKWISKKNMQQRP